MGFLQSSWSFSRYFVIGDLPDDYEKQFASAVERYAFRNMEEQSAEERRIGWAGIHDMFQTRVDLMGFLNPPYISLTLRIDKKHVPPKALLRYTKEAEAAVREQEALEYLPRARRLEIKDAVNLNLIKRAIPDSSAYDMVWNLETGMVMFGSANAKLGDEFSELFTKTFDLTLTPVFPYALGLSLLEKDGKEAGRMDDMTPMESLEDDL